MYQNFSELKQVREAKNDDMHHTLRLHLTSSAGVLLFLFASDDFFRTTYTNSLYTMNYGKQFGMCIANKEITLLNKLSSVRVWVCLFS